MAIARTMPGAVALIDVLSGALGLAGAGQLLSADPIRLVLGC